MIPVPNVVVLATLYILKEAAPYDEEARRLYILLLDVVERIGVPPSLIRKAKDCLIPAALLNLHQVEGLPGIQSLRQHRKRKRRDNDKFAQEALW